MVPLVIRYFIKQLSVWCSTQQHKLLVSTSGFLKQIILNQAEQLCIANHRALLSWLKYFTMLLLIYLLCVNLKQKFRFIDLLVHCANFLHVSYVCQT